MKEIVFFTEKNEEGKYIAQHFSEEGVLREATSLRELKEAITNYYKDSSITLLVRLYFKKDKYDITFYTKKSELSICL